VQLETAAQQSGATVLLTLDQPATLTANGNGVVSILLIPLKNPSLPGAPAGGGLWSLIAGEVEFAAIQ
jgi:hypothetical protein